MGNCSIHSHFEFLDTANALPNPDHKNIPDLMRALKAYQAAGYSHVAVTEHGSFSSYEDLRAMGKKVGVMVIPAVEGYIQGQAFRGKEGDFLYQGSHVILIAKDEEGYHSLVKIMNHSEYNTAKQRMEIPIAMLQEHTAKGHIICSSACIGGIMAAPLFKEIKEQRAMEKNRAILEKFHFAELMAVKKEQERLKELSTTAYKTKKRNAEKRLEALRGTSEEAVLQEEVDMLAQKEQDILSAAEELRVRRAEFAENDARIKAANKHKCKSRYEAVLKYHPPTEEERQENRRKLDEIYQTFQDIFGDDFYIELQNHHLEEERSIYNTIITYCEGKRAEGIAPRYIQSNDTHICCRPDDPNAEKLIQARNVMKLARMNIYDAFDSTDREYCIKTEEEISGSLHELCGTYFDLLSGMEQESMLTEGIIEESAANTHILESISFAPNKANHYPAIKNASETFEQKLTEGIRERFGCTLEELPGNYKERILSEKKIMEGMNVIDYHVIVEEFLRFARYYGRIPAGRRAEVESYIEDTEKVVAFVEENQFPEAISTGPGRGSAAGSLICYCLGITNIDPIVYGLSMERYLNPERVSMPDIDSDIRNDIREAVIRHCEKKYGYVCKIGTKSYCALRSAIDRAADYIAHKHYEEDGVEQTEGVTFEEYKKRWLAAAKEFKNTFLSGDVFEFDMDDLTDEEREQLEEQERADFAQKLVGVFLTPEQQEICDYYPFAMGQFTHLGQHACGMIISKDRLDDTLPMYYNSARDNWQTQMTYPQAEELGYLKMDMLGLMTLDILNEVQQETGDHTLLEDIIKHKGTYEVMRSGKTECIFQMNGKRVAAHMRDCLKPDCIEDIIGENALNRPGPWDTFHEDYAARKHNPDYKGEHSIDTSYSEALTKILAPTYGCLLYQEQVMEIFRQLSGYTMGAADNVRRAMGKKKDDVLAAERPKFVHGNNGWLYQVSYLTESGEQKSFPMTVMADTKEGSKEEITKLWKENRFADYAADIGRLVSITLKEAYVPGCERNGIPVERAEQLFDIMAEFAKYAFNKSHAAVYSVLTCHTAYFKYKYPAVLYAATLNFQGDPKKRKNILSEASGVIRIEPPRLSNFSYRFKGKGDIMMYGLCGIKGFGDSLKDVPVRYSRNLYEFCVLNPEFQKNNMEALIMVGFFDEWGYTRQSLLKVLPTCMAQAQKQADTEENVDFYAEKVYPVLNAKENFISLQSGEEYFEALQWENTLMGIGLSIKNGLQILQSNKNTEPYHGGGEWCNFVVLSCSAARTTKNGKVYYEATLSDVDGNLVSRRFSQPMTSACVRAYVYPEDKKYFIMDCTKYQPKALARAQYNLDEARLSEAQKIILKPVQTATHSIEVISDATGKPMYVQPKVFERLKEMNYLYEADFKRIFANAGAM